MPKSLEDLIRIAAAGGGMQLDGSRSTEDLIRLAAAASKKGARILVSDADQKSTEDLVRIAAAGKGCVSFDLPD